MERYFRKTKWLILPFLALCLGLVLFFGIHSMRQTVAANSEKLETAQQSDPVDDFKAVRQQLRAMQKAQLNDVAHNAQTDPELAEMAQRQLILLCEREEDELTLEGIFEMRGWENPVVTVHEDSVNVLLKTEMISQQESSVILELVCRETGVQSGNVKIIPIN